MKKLKPININLAWAWQVWFVTWWWSSTEWVTNLGRSPASTRISAWMYCLSGDGSFLKCYDYKQMEYYIRCVKD